MGAAVDVFRVIGKVRARKKISCLKPGSVLTDYDVRRVQNPEVRLEDLDSVSLNRVKAVSVVC